MDSILTSIKKALGMEESYIAFDPDIIMFINMALMALTQLGIGPSTGFSITDKSAVWADLLGERDDIEGVKAYVLFKTRLGFDPPGNSFLIESINRQISELEWRLNIQAETTVTTTVEGGTVSGQ